MPKGIDECTVELLEWLYDENSSATRTHVSAADCPAEWTEDQQYVYQVAKHAESRGLLKGSYSLGGRVSVMITPRGISEVEKIRADRRNPAVRVPALRSLMLNWLYAQDSAGEDPQGWGEFISNPEYYLSGQPFQEREVQRQASYLYEAGFIDAQEIDQEPAGSIYPRLLQAGHDCVIEFGGNVAEYKKQSQGGTTNNVYMADNRGNMAIGSSDFVQAVKSGVDTTELLKFAGAVRQILPTLDLPEEQSEQLGQYAEELHEEASREDPDIGLLKRLWQAVMEGLAGASQTVTGDLVNQLGQEAIKAIGGA